MIAVKSPTPLRETPAAASERTDDQIIADFHNLYRIRKDETWCNTTWFGTRIFKCPLDTWVYQELMYEVQPDVIIECGTLLGGSALFLCMTCDLLGKGRVITIDIDPSDGKPRHPRLTYLRGSSTSPEIIQKVKAAIKPGEKVLVILDSDHTRDHVLNELRLYSPLVPLGSYVIVEDTNINGHPYAPEFGPGPYEAVEDFLKEDHHFDVDLSREKFMMTFNPRGYLKRVR
jgi:cephalosporin hydroxylase